MGGRVTMSGGVTLRGLDAWEGHVEKGMMQHRGVRVPSEWGSVTLRKGPPAGEGSQKKSDL